MKSIIIHKKLIKLYLLRGCVYFVIINIIMKIDRETRVKLQKQIKEANLPKKTKDIINRLLDDTKLGLKLYFEESEETTKNADGHDVPLSSLNYTYFEEDKSKRLIFEKDKPNHLLIEGDNYYALKHLKKIGQKVDIIYIDPPYNTGNEFVYNDKLVGKDDSFKHSYWLSFMKKRLELARDLMNDDAIIFVSIDDNEQAYLKVLMDEIFGEDNFISNVPRVETNQGKNDVKTIANRHDYILIYSNINEMNGIKIDSKDYKYNDKDGRGPYHLKTHLVANRSLGYVKSLDFPIEYNGKEFLPIDKNGRNRWRWNKERIEKAFELNILIERKGYLYQKSYLNLEYVVGSNELKPRAGKTRPVSSIEFIQNCFSNKEGTKNIDQLNLIFSFPKPVELIKKLIKLHPKNDLIILDFFAGSGTTGHAVMEMNSETNSRNKFIGITLGLEELGLNICEEITFERLKRISSGEATNRENFSWLEKNKPFKENIKYLVSKPFNKFNGNLYSLNINKDLYKEEFDADLTVELIADE